MRGVLIRKGQVVVQLNTYDSFVDVNSSGLAEGSIYTFSIDNPPPNVPSTATISTIDVASGQIKVIDETFRFGSGIIPLTVGDITVTVVSSSSSATDRTQTKFESYGARFPTGWSITRNEGNGLIFSGGRVYAYAPSAIYTRNRNSPTYIDFTPFRGLPSKRIPIRQIPRIVNEGNFLYSITPPTRVKVSWSDSVLRRSIPGMSHDSQIPIGSIDVRQFASGAPAGVKIVAIF